jgi:hypothetical protein
MKEKNKNQGGKLKWSKKVQIKYVINLSVPNIPGARGQEERGAASNTRRMRHRWYRRGSAVLRMAFRCLWGRSKYIYVYDRMNRVRYFK